MIKIRTVLSVKASQVFLRLGCLLGFATDCIAESEPIYQVSTAPIAARVEDLLSRMNTKEKLAQISGNSIPPPMAGVSGVPEEWLVKHFGSGVGIVPPTHRSNINDQIAVRTSVREFLKKRTRLGIPAIFHDEAAHGFLNPETTSFPAPIGLACTWDETLIERIYDRVAREARARGTDLVLAPVVDVTLDPRWGRTNETLGEDPYLNGRLGTAIVKGLQGGASGEIDAYHVMATLKHLAGHGVSEGGLNQSPAHIGALELRETHIAPFAAIIHKANPAAIMPSYNEVDGIPSHSNRAMLLDLVRGEYGFTGLYVSDYSGILQLYNKHNLVATKAEAARLALESGVQVELPSAETFSQLEPLLGKDAALDALVDNAVRAVLYCKFKLGLFDEPVALDAVAAHAISYAPEFRELALQAARESIVLLKNEGALLPFTVEKYKRIAVIGPNADVARLGGYSGRPIQTVSLLEGLRARVGSRVEIMHAEGCKIVKNDSKDAYLNTLNVTGTALPDPVENHRLIAEATAVAEKADLVILAVGENEKIANEAFSKKLGDRSSLDLFGDQVELVRTILATGKPVVLFLSNGRPISLHDLADRVPVIIEGWYAGQETGHAAAEILFGDTNPSGKLTLSIPRSADHIPAQYRRKPSSAEMTYLFDSHTAAFPFGFGLSYTTFAYKNLRTNKTQVGKGESVQVSVDLTNTGHCSGVEIVQLYLRDEVSSVTRPVMELRGFQRVSLEPGETRPIIFEVTPDDLAFYNRDLMRVVEPGWFTVMVGGSSVDTKKERFEVK